MERAVRPREPFSTRTAVPTAARLAVSGYHRPMAVPKRKQTSTRRDKRRAQHRLEAPRVNTCPVCHQPKRPHHVCPNCKTYRGRDVEPLPTAAP
jgi:large subunit ribosomal protein L32